MIHPHAAVQKAVRDGLLEPITKNTKCVDCGKRAYYYDHRDYAKPLQVEAVCRRCNGLRGSAKNRDLVPYRSDRTIFVCLTPKTKKALKAAAQREGRSMSRQAARIIEQGLTA